jgi:class 3 adenylate cyclase
VLSPSAKFCPECAHPTGLAQEIRVATRPTYPEGSIPKHLAENILTSKIALEGERKQVTALFADLKGSMDLFADRDAEEARRILDPVIEQMMEAVLHFGGTAEPLCLTMDPSSLPGLGPYLWRREGGANKQTGARP